MEARLKMASTQIKGGKPAQKSNQETKFFSVRVMLNATFLGINDSRKYISQV